MICVIRLVGSFGLCWLWYVVLCVLMNRILVLLCVWCSISSVVVIGCLVNRWLGRLIIVFSRWVLSRCWWMVVFLLLWNSMLCGMMIVMCFCCGFSVCSMCWI